jgi:hypothetical protein
MMIPSSIDPDPIPVSNARIMLPNAAPRLPGSILSFGDRLLNLEIPLSLYSHVIFEVRQDTEEFRG